ncbi:hypothetical protein F4X86_01545, partial [Candidatus Saccharibacteria bacterium]|nr:hypothetical protein [Candidatus Saccharibacteria bacterium]
MEKENNSTASSADTRRLEQEISEAEAAHEALLAAAAEQHTEVARLLRQLGDSVVRLQEAKIREQAEQLLG